MAESKSAVVEALVEGATRGLSGNELFVFVQTECPTTKTKKIVKSAFWALSDPDLKDRNILDTIYALALRHRLDETGADADEDGDDQDEKPVVAVEPTKPKPRAKSPLAATLPLPERAPKKRKKS